MIPNMMNEIREMQAFRRGEGPDDQVNLEVQDQLDNLAAAAEEVQQRLRENGNGEIRALAALADQFAAIDPRAAAAPLQEQLFQNHRDLEEEKSKLSEVLEQRESYLRALYHSQEAAKNQIAALTEKLKSTPAIHPAALVISSVGDKACSHMIQPQIGRITDAPRSRLPSGRL